MALKERYHKQKTKKDNVDQSSLKEQYEKEKKEANMLRFRGRYTNLKKIE